MTDNVGTRGMILAGALPRTALLAGGDPVMLKSRRPNGPDL